MDLDLDKVNDLLAKLMENTEKRAEEARKTDDQEKTTDIAMMPGASEETAGQPRITRKVQDLRDDYLLVVAIDFGTTFSGYAFSFRNQQGEIKMNKNWGQGFDSYKTPTCVLLDKNAKFVAFGYEAEAKYANMMGSEDQEYYCFQRFKMTLHSNPELNDKTMLMAANGKKLPALDIFAHSLKYLKDHFVQAVQRNATDSVEAKYVRWVITVPAIWSDASKQFMRHAALKAELIDSLESGQLVIALEPEAASLHCRTLPVHMFAEKYGHKESVHLSAGTKYMVIDAGGGTVDVTCHEVQENGTVKELHYATGGALGGTMVDVEFEKLMKETFGEDFIDKYKKENASEWLKMMNDFEKKKRSVNVDGNQATNMPLQYSFGTKFKAVKGLDVDKALAKGKVQGVGFNNGMISIRADKIRELFQHVVDNIVKHIKELMKIPKLQGIQYFFMVGGFSECSVLQQSIFDKFDKHVKILIPNDAGLAVMKGAVLFGHHPTAIESRIAAHTYGIKCRTDFQSGFHDEARKVIIGGAAKVENSFSVFIRQGDEVKDGHSCTNDYSPSNPGQGSATVEIMSTESRDVKYTDERGVHEHGTIDIEWPGEGLDRKLFVTMTFGMTEIQVSAVSQPGGKKANKNVDFLAK